MKTIAFPHRWLNSGFSIPAWAYEKVASGVRRLFSPGTPVSSTTYNWLENELATIGINVTKSEISNSRQEACKKVSSNLVKDNGLPPQLRFPPPLMTIVLISEITFSIE